MARCKSKTFSLLYQKKKKGKERDVPKSPLLLFPRRGEEYGEFVLTSSSTRFLPSQEALLRKQCCNCFVFQSGRIDVYGRVPSEFASRLSQRTLRPPSTFAPTPVYVPLCGSSLNTSARAIFLACLSDLPKTRFRPAIFSARADESTFSSARYKGL